MSEKVSEKEKRQPAVNLQKLFIKLGAGNKLAPEGFWQGVQNEIQSILNDCVTLSVQEKREPVELLINQLQRSFFLLEKICPHDYAETPEYFLGQLNMLCELSAMILAMTLPFAARNLLDQKPMAVKVLKKLSERVTIEYSTLAKSLRIVNTGHFRFLIQEMVDLDLIRRDKFGKSEVLSATPAARIACAMPMRHWPSS